MIRINGAGRFQPNYKLEINEIVRISRLTGSDVLDKDSDLIVWAGTPLLETVDSWHGRRVKDWYQESHNYKLFRICDTGEFIFRVLSIEQNTIGQLYAVEWITARPVMSLRSTNEKIN